MTLLPPFAGPEDVRAVEQRPIEAWTTGATVPEVLAAGAGRYGPEIACRLFADARLEGPPRDLTFADLHRRIRAAAALFRSLGIGRRDVVAYLLPTLPQTIEICWGAVEAGIAMPINPFLEPGTIAAMLARVGARVLCIEGPSGTDGTYDKLAELKRLVPGIEHVLIVGEDRPVAGGTAYEAVRDGFLGREPAALPMPGPEDIAAYFHTGGTTGAPKIVRLTHRNLAVMAFISAFGAGIRPGDRMPCGMPLFHVGGLVMGSLAPLAHGARIIQLTRRGYRQPGLLDAFWRFVEREQANILVGPPTVLIEAMQRFTDGVDVGSVRGWISSAAALPAEVHRRFVQRTGIPVFEAWGLTEATLVLTFAPPEGLSKPGTVGIRLPYCEVAVAELSPEGEVVRLLPEGEAGAIIGRSPAVFPGYLDEAANRGVLLEGGWLNTGDLGFLDRDGYLAVSGRAKDIIKRGGHGIDPKVIEEALTAHPDVALAAAVGRPDRRLGEVPIAFVAPSPGASIDPAQLLDWAAARIDERAAIPKEIVIVRELPLTGVGKVHKPSLRLEACRRAAASLLGIDIAEVKAFEGVGGRARIALSETPASSAAALLAELGLELVHPPARED